MEGMVALIVQMAADALQIPVEGKATLILDTHPMTLEVYAVP